MTKKIVVVDDIDDVVVVGYMYEAVIDQLIDVHMFIVDVDVNVDVFIMGDVGCC